MRGAQEPVAGELEPTGAERARTTLWLSGPLTAHAAGSPGRRIDLYGAEEDGSPLLVLPVDDPLVEAVRAAPAFAPDVPAIVEARDVYPIPQAGPLRTPWFPAHTGGPPVWVRTQLWLAGWLTELLGPERREAAVTVSDRSPAPELLDVGSSRTVLRLEAGQILLGSGETDGPTAEDAVDVDLVAYAVASPDPLADHEAAHLTHLVDHHPDELVLLCQLIDPDLRRDAVSIAPGRLDRYGLEVCVRTESGCHQARLSFPEAITHSDQLPGAMQALLRRAAACCGGTG